MARSPYAGRRPATATVPRVDEQRFIARYQQIGNLAQCLREFGGLSERRGRTILKKHGVQLQSKRRAPADEKAVLRCFARSGTVTAVAVLLGIGEPEIRAILDRHDVAHDARSPVPDFDSKTLAQRLAQQRLAREPSPSDLLNPAEAARIAGIAPASALAGKLPNRGTRHQPRYRRDETLALRDALRGSGEIGGTCAS